MEETIYKLFESSLPPIPADGDGKRKRALVDTKINLLKEPHFLPPARARTAAEFYHLNSKKVLQSAFTVQRREHGTFGLPKKAYQLRRTDENTIVPTLHLPRSTSAARQYDFEPDDKTHYKPNIPRIEEGPVQGLSSNLNFIDVNCQRAASLRPPKPRRPVDYLAKPNYGRAPGYLDRVKGTIEQEKEYLTMIARARKPPRAETIPLSADEIAQLREGLRRRHEEVNRDYQSITHVSKVYSEGVKRKKEACERELLRLERDLKMLEREVILVDARL